MPCAAGAQSSFGGGGKTGGRLQVYGPPCMHAPRSAESRSAFVHAPSASSTRLISRSCSCPTTSPPTYTQVGLNYICATAERFFAVGAVLGNMVVAQAQMVDQPSQRLLKHIIRCYLRLSDNPRWGRRREGRQAEGDGGIGLRGRENGGGSSGAPALMWVMHDGTIGFACGRLWVELMDATGVVQATNTAACVIKTMAAQRR